MRRAAIGLEPLATNPTVDDLVPHRAFHTALYVASHNDVLIATLEALWDKTDRYRRLGLEAIRSKEELDQKARKHAELLAPCSGATARAPPRSCACTSRRAGARGRSLASARKVRARP
jgi:DNA-binding FadR family transcriptional regulator